MHRMPATICGISTAEIWQILLSPFLYEFRIFSEIKSVQSQAGKPVENTGSGRTSSFKNVPAASAEFLLLLNQITKLEIGIQVLDGDGFKTDLKT